MAVILEPWSHGFVGVYEQKYAINKMEEIFEPNSTFAFDKLIFSPPTVVPGGNYFIKFSINGNPLYIQSPKCNTKLGIVKAGKKMYCDLMMSNINENFIQWMENLESYTQETIYKNRSKWFETELEKHDIENSFTSPLRSYKSGKFYIARTNIPTRLGKCVLKIYDENENNVELDSIKDSTNIITILEIQGVKCSARSFQIEIEMKQMMVLKPSNLFERCIIKSSNGGSSTISNPDIVSVPPSINLPVFEKIDLGKKSEESETLEESIDSTKEVMVDPEIFNQEVEDLILPESIKIELPPINEMTEVEFHLDELPENETVTLKQRNDVYYQMYKEAKQKAKIARNLALSSYLEAKRIKNTYMLNEDSDSDLDEDELDFEDQEQEEYPEK